MILERYTRPWREPIADALPADYFELTAIVVQGKEIMNAEKHYSSKIYILRCSQCESVDLDFLGPNSVMCHGCNNVDNFRLGSRIPVQ